MSQSKPKKKKDFDCVDMQDQAALRIYEETKDMTIEEELAYWRRVGEAWDREQQNNNAVSRSK